MSGRDVVTPRFCFSAQRRKDLLKLGLVDAQIDALEAALPMCRLLITDDPPLGSVRERLESVKQAISDARREICQFADEPAVWEARHRIDAASYALGVAQGTAARACGALDELSGVVGKAIFDLGATQRRTNSAAPAPIRWIHEALVRGWAKGAQGPIRQFNIKVSSNPGSVFGQVVGICYETMKDSQDTVEPLRAMRSYMDYWNRATAKRGAARGSVVTQDEKFDREKYKSLASGTKNGRGPKK